MAYELSSSANIYIPSISWLDSEERRCLDVKREHFASLFIFLDPMQQKRIQKRHPIVNEKKKHAIFCVSPIHICDVEFHAPYGKARSNILCAMCVRVHWKGDNSQLVMQQMILPNICNYRLRFCISIVSNQRQLSLRAKYNTLCMNYVLCIRLHTNWERHGCSRNCGDDNRDAKNTYVGFVWNFSWTALGSNRNLALAAFFPFHSSTLYCPD